MQQYGKCLISTIILLTNSGDVSLHFKDETFEKLFVRQNHVQAHIFGNHNITLTNKLTFGIRRSL